jgi:hypothetical protein
MSPQAFCGSLVGSDEIGVLPLVRFSTDDNPLGNGSLSADFTDGRCGRQLKLESLEERRLLAIIWANQGSATNDSDNFTDVYGPSIAPLARSIVSRAIDDGNGIITVTRKKSCVPF